MGLHKPLFITYPTRNLCVVVLKAGDVRTYYIGFDLAPEPGPGKGASSTQDPPPLTQDDSLKRRLRGLRVEGKSGPFPTCLRHLPPPALRPSGFSVPNLCRARPKVFLPPIPSVKMLHMGDNAI